MPGTRLLMEEDMDKRQTTQHERSAEQKHREILQAALRGRRRRMLAEALGAMPDVGRDEDFRRRQDDSRG